MRQPCLALWSIANSVSGNREGSAKMLQDYFPVSYRAALICSGYELLSTRRERASHELFDQIKNPLHILNDLLTLRVNNDGCARTRDSYPYVIPRQKTNRLSKSLIAFGVLRKW